MRGGWRWLAFLLTRGLHSGDGVAVVRRPGYLVKRAIICGQGAPRRGVATPLSLYLFYPPSHYYSFIPRHLLVQPPAGHWGVCMALYIEVD